MSYDPLHPFKVLITPQTYKTEHKYVIFGLFEDETEVKHNSNSIVRGVFSTHPRYHLPKEKNHCLLPEPDSTDSLILKVEDAGEDPHTDCARVHGRTEETDSKGST